MGVSLHDWSKLLIKGIPFELGAPRVLLATILLPIVLLLKYLFPNIFEIVLVYPQFSIANTLNLFNYHFQRVTAAAYCNTLHHQICAYC